MKSDAASRYKPPHGPFGPSIPGLAGPTQGLGRKMRGLGMMTQGLGRKTQGLGIEMGLGMKR